MFKSKHTFAPKTVEDIFVKSNENHYNNWHQSDFRWPLIKTVYYSRESISYLSSKLWDITPKKLKEVSLLKSQSENGHQKTAPADCKSHGKT